MVKGIQNADNKDNIPIIIVGDIALDWLAANYSGSPDDDRTWARQPRVQMLAMASGAWLIENFLLQIGDPKANPHNYFCYERPPGGTSATGGMAKYGTTRRTADPKEYLHSYTTLDLFSNETLHRLSCTTFCPVFLRSNLASKFRGAQPRDSVPGGGGISRTKSYRINAPTKYWGPESGTPINQPGIDLLRLRRALEPAPYFDPQNDGGRASIQAHKNEINKILTNKQKRVLVIFDGGGGFREDKSRWTEFLPEPTNGKSVDKNLFIVVFLRPPFARADHEPEKDNPLLHRIQSYYSDQTIVVVAADSLRREGVNISRGLSWERTAQDFGSEIYSNKCLQALCKARHVVVRFGLTGAIHLHHGENGPRHPDMMLYYDPRFVEGEYRDHDADKHGSMSGMTALLTATIVRSIANGISEQKQTSSSINVNLNNWIGRGIHTGLLNCRTLFCHGFGQKHSDVLRLELDDRWNDEFLSPDQLDDGYMHAIVHEKVELNTPAWTLLKFNSINEIEKIATNIVQQGIEVFDKSDLHFPAAKFGKFWVVDREELESFRSIRNLLQDHREKRTTIPLSIAVFGPPGSGKSFGVKAIAESDNPENTKVITYNIAQFVHPSELSQALLPIRDIALDGKLAVVFFDEFDSQVDNSRLFWLKFFLPIMQDGEFKHGESIIKTGGAVFVFAGGTSPTYQHFCRMNAPEEEQTDFRDRKGPDFVSRLRGYVNVRGADQQNGDDWVYMIRRAILLRSMFSKDYPSLFADNILRIDPNVVRAMLKIEKYKHGARSLGAVLEMSRLATATHFDASMLPSVDQLEMHVDTRAFMRLLKGAE
jgi:hypothetical protein